jgi:hypothetical protein
VRIFAFYLPIWIAILITIAIFIVTWREMLKTRRDLKEGLTNHSQYEGTITELRSTGQDSSEAGDDSQPLTDIPLDAAYPGPKSGLLRLLDKKQPHGHHSKGITPDKRQQGPGPSHSQPPPTLKIDAAAWAYATYAMIYFVALLITWVSISSNHQAICAFNVRLITNPATDSALDKSSLCDSSLYGA